MTVLELANAIIDKNNFTITEAWCYAWRILNEYPTDFRIAALEISRGKKPNISVKEMSFQKVEQLSGRKNIEALELLRIYANDEDEGKNMIFTVGMRDGLR